MQNNSAIRIRDEVTEDGRVLSLDGELTLFTAGALRTALIAAMQLGARLVLRFDGVTSIDIAGLQLICSAHRTYLVHGAVLELSQASETVREAVRAAGYRDCDSECGRRLNSKCIWKE